MSYSTLEDLRQRYSGSIWLRSEITYLEGPLRNSFDPPDIQARMPQRFRVTVTTPSGKHYAVETYGEVGRVYFDTGQKLLIFQTIFGEQLADFAVVTDRVQQKSVQLENRKTLSGVQSLGVES